MSYTNQNFRLFHVSKYPVSLFQYVPCGVDVVHILLSGVAARASMTAQFCRPEHFPRKSNQIIRYLLVI